MYHVDNYAKRNGISNYEFLDFVCNFRYYINYKLMKKKVKRYTQQIQVGTQSRHYVLKDFSRLLDCQVRPKTQWFCR